MSGRNTKEKRKVIKIQEIRPEELRQGQQEAYQDDVDRYRSKRDSFLRRNCPGCGSKSSYFFSAHEDFQFTRCAACFTVFMNPGPTEEIVGDLYANSTNYAYWAEVIYPRTREARRNTLHKERAYFVLKSAEKLRNRKSIKVLELGAGTGDSMAVLTEEAGFEVDGFAIEPNPSMWESLKLNGVNIVTAYEEIAEEKFDLIVAYEVLEHILEPRLFVNSYKKLLSTDGYFLFSTPNAHSLEVQMLGNQSTTLDIEHISVLTPSAVHSIAGFAGMEVVEITTPGNFDMELIANEISWVKKNFSDSKIAEFQDSIKHMCFSSHMKVVMKPLES